MGNSPPSRKQGRKPKKYESQSQSAEDEDEYEEVEESYLEEVDSQMTPKPSNQSRTPRLEAPVTPPRPPRVPTSKPVTAQYERWKKPIRNCTMFARHYFMTLHKLEVAVGMQDEKYWLTNLESSPEETSFRLSNQQPWGVTASDRDIHATLPDWHSMAQRESNFAQPPFQPGSQIGVGKPPDKRNSNIGQIGQTGPVNQPGYSINGYDMAQNPFVNTNNGQIQPREQLSEFSKPRIGNYDDLSGQQPTLNGQTIPKGAYQSYSVPPGQETGPQSQKPIKYVNTDQYYEEVLETNRDQEGNYNENTFIKTTYNQSEANSEDQGSRTQGYCRPENPCYEENCRECLEVLRRNEGQTLTTGRQKNLPNSRVMRDIKLEVDREAMLEKYLENLVANKPSKVQKLLVEQYCRKRSNDKEPGLVTNRISDALRQRVQSRSRESGEDGRESYIIQQLDDQLKTQLRNAEPALLTECGVKLVDDKFGNKVPLKLLKFVKDDSIYGKGSINFGSAADRYENNNIAYLSDRYQLKNYITKQREDKPTTTKKSYTNLQSEKLWPKQVKFDKNTIGKQLQKNEKTRAQQEADTLKHALNYTAVKHHPRNLNFKSETDKPASPKWGSPRDSAKTNNKTTPYSDFSPIQPKAARSEKLPGARNLDSQASTARSYIKDRMALVREAIEADADVNINN
jgi:hypothetical protein